MAYEADTVFSSAAFTGNYRILSGVRDADGVMYAMFYDEDTSGGRKKSCRLYKSLGEGRPGTWAAESWSQEVGSEGNGDGGTQPHLILQPDNSLWAAFATWDGQAYPYVLQRSEDQEMWGAFGRFFVGFHKMQGTHANVASFHAVSDPYYHSLGVWNIAAIYLYPSSNECYYVDLGQTTPQKVHTATNYTDCRLLAGSNGWKMAFLLDSSNNLYSVAIASWGTSVQFSPRILIDTNVQTLEDVATRFDNMPACIYRKLESGTWRLYFAEYSAITSSWANQRMWDGVNDIDLHPGQSLSYDQKGSVFVTGYGDPAVSPADDWSLLIWSHLRGINPLTTTWEMFDVTTDMAELPKDTFIYGSMNPLLYGFQPQRPIQGLIFLALIASGSPTTHSVVFINRDQIDDPATNYPTMLQHFGGEPFFRLGDDKTRTSKVLQLEGAAAGSAGLIPYIPSFDYIEEATFKVSEVRFEAGYSAQVLKFAEGRTLYTLSFKNVDTGRAGVLRTFFEDRQVDGKTVTLTLPNENGDVEELHVTPTPITVTKEHGGTYEDSIWSLTVQLISKV